MPRTLVIGDTHAPFMHKDAVPFLAAVADEFKPKNIVHIGDVADFHALSRFVKNPDGRSAGDENDLAVSQLRPLYKLFPKVSVCIGNHDRRLQDRAEVAGIPARMLRNLSEVLEMNGKWTWADDHEFDGVVHEHGDPFGGRDAHIKVAAANMQSSVIGHVHAHAGVAYTGNRKHLVYGFNVGCLIDHKAYAFAYAKKAAAKPIIGCGIIDDGRPIFIPMPLNSLGRWRGKL